LQQKHDFSDADITAFQILADNFFREWLQLVGYNGVTNYVHMLGAGHLKYYLKKWRNLNRFSNQGWEAYNQMVASFWHHRTTKGGSKVDRSRIRPIARWLLRLMMWKTGEGDRFFQECERNKVIPRDEDDALGMEESDDEGDSDDDVV
jgi:hypothetical protein